MGTFNDGYTAVMSLSHTNLNGNGTKMKSIYSCQTAIGDHITDISYYVHSKSCFSFSKPKEATMRKWSTLIQW